MPFLIAAAFSVLLAWVRGAPPTLLATVRLRFLPLPMVAFLLQLFTFVKLEETLSPVAPWLHAASLTLVALFLVANVTLHRGLALVLAGVTMNAAVIGLNGGYMPVNPADAVRIGFPEQARQLQEAGRFQKSVVLDENTRLPWLADIIHLPLPGGPDRLISIGDIFVGLGTFVFLQEALVRQRRSSRGSSQGSRRPVIEALPA